MRPKNLRSGKPLQGRSFSKATPRCPAKRADFFPAPPGGASRKNPPDSGGLAVAHAARDAMASEPLAAAAVAIPGTAHAVFHPAMPPAFAAAKPTAMGEHGKAPLLALVERLVERIGRIGDLLQRRSRSRHVVGALAQPRDRVIRRLLAVGVA